MPSGVPNTWPTKLTGRYPPGRSPDHRLRIWRRRHFSEQRQRHTIDTAVMVDIKIQISQNRPKAIVAMRASVQYGF